VDSLYFDNVEPLRTCRRFGRMHCSAGLMTTRTGSERGRPLRRVSTGKKASVPNFFLIGLHTLLPRSLLHRLLLEPVISSFDFGSFPC
jgi:hypothetical protein